MYRPNDNYVDPDTPWYDDTEDVIWTIYNNGCRYEGVLTIIFYDFYNNIFLDEDGLYIPNILEIISSKEITILKYREDDLLIQRSPEEFIHVEYHKGPILF